MKMTKTGNRQAQPDPNDIKHPNWPFKKITPVNPYNTPPDQRFAHDCKSKREPIVRSVATEEEMRQPDLLAQI
jgi:hypothetical protein